MYMRTREKLRQVVTTVNTDRAVHLNRHYARLLGWQAHIGRIVGLLGFTITPDERAFTEAVARWQQRQGLTGDGVIGPVTWSRLRAALRTQDLSRSFQLGLAALGKNKFVKIREKQVKSLIKAKDLEVYALIERISIPCKVRKGKVRKGNCLFGEVRRETIRGEEHVWTLAVTGSIGQISKLGLTVPILVPGLTSSLQPIKKTSKGKITITHPILIFVNPLRLVFGWPELKKQIPNKQKRVEFSFAESLFHELIHATILIERTLPAGSAHTRIFTEFDRTLKAANSARLNKEREDVRNNLRILIAFAGIPQTDPAADVEKYFEFLINEKFANQTAASAFGRPTSNAQTADAYSKEVANRIESSGTPFSDRKSWKIRVSQLSQAVSQLYDKIDEKLAVPEIIPRPVSYCTPYSKEPAIERLD